MASAKRVAWITGAGRGIGRACALGLAQDGFAVGLSARTKKELEATARDCPGVATLASPCDVTQAKDIARAYRAIEKGLGAPAVLVNAAGMARSAAFLESTPKFFDEHWRLNVLGSVHATQAALPRMLRAEWGRVVNIASIAGKVGAPYIAAYAASKHALLGVTRSLALEVAAKGVTVNAVCPGYVDTKMTDDNLAFMEKKTGRPRQEILERILRSNPLHRLIKPEEVAALVRHLCRDESAGINGQAFTIDGGETQW